MIEQKWLGVDGAVAWHLMERQANNWEEIGAMMDAWLKENTDAELAAANERIRELEAKCCDASAIYDAQILSEREVSDKLVAALQRIAKLRIVEVDGILDDYIDVIAAAIRKGQA